MSQSRNSPPPRSAQNRSAFSLQFAAIVRPSAITTSADKRLSQVAQLGPSASLFGRVQAVKLMKHNALRHLMGRSNNSPISKQFPRPNFVAAYANHYGTFARCLTSASPHTSPDTPSYRS